MCGKSGGKCIKNLSVITLGGCWGVETVGDNLHFWKFFNEDVITLVIKSLLKIFKNLKRNMYIYKYMWIYIYENVYLCVHESLCHRPESNTALVINYTPNNIKS